MEDVPVWAFTTAIGGTGALLLILWGVVRSRQDRTDERQINDEKRMEEHFMDDNAAHERLTRVETKVEGLEKEVRHTRDRVHDIIDELPQKIIVTIRQVWALLKSEKGE